MTQKRPHKIALLCGGPSKERGISLNSARSFLDHTQPLDIDLSIFYMHPTGLFYELSPADLYSNTPSDFDFKLESKGLGLQEKEWINKLKGIDLLFPLIHGNYGEDGTLQTILEQHEIPFAGSSSSTCQQMFHKHKARKQLENYGFALLPALYIDSPTTPIELFWQTHKIERGIIKPALSGSSIGIRIVTSVQEATQAVSSLWEEGFYELILEPYSEDAEFTVCVVSHVDKPVAFIPLEIDIQRDGIFDYRKKYLPTMATRCYCPPRFSTMTTMLIRKEAEKLFSLFSIRDYVRIDGWVAKDGSIRFSDFNPLSGMEQNSFIFQQAARIGLSHTDLLEYLINQALFRYKKPAVERKIEQKGEKQPVYVLMGGNTSERQVSLLSGTNVWLKLLQSSQYAPSAFLLDTKQKVWQIPYDFALHHTVEEMMEHCKRAKALVKQIDPLARSIRHQLGISCKFRKDYPIRMSLSTFLERAKEAKAFVFLALHGGIGEDGTLQKRLEQKTIPFNGSSSRASKLCMDKYKTAQTISSLQNPFILPMPQMIFRAKEVSDLWQRATEMFQTTDLLIKPRKDGCSTGVVRLSHQEELLKYIELYVDRHTQAKAGSFVHHPSPIEMPTAEQTWFILEPFIQTDKIYVLETRLCHQKISGWCEMTIGILEKEGKYLAFNPSITLAMHHILSVEEKFQGGTGINLTPPPEEILCKEAKQRVQHSACEAAKALGIQGYGRLDLFVECATGVIRVIEANTLPALSPSTVLYQQALAEDCPITPQQLLTEFIRS